MPLEYTIPPSLLVFFLQQAQQKISTEGWEKQGRNAPQKVQNFFNCWATEEAFKQILISKGVWFRNRGLYFGDAQGAGADFTLKIGGEEVTVGLRSIGNSSLEIYKQMTYPDDRIREEPEKIADYHVVCHHDGNGFVRIFGMISKEEMMEELEKSERKYSVRNQEYFRVVDLDRFSNIPKLLHNTKLLHIS